jgi:hypothetical protein
MIMLLWGERVMMRVKVRRREEGRRVLGDEGWKSVSKRRVGAVLKRKSPWLFVGGNKAGETDVVEEN